MLDFEVPTGTLSIFNTTYVFYMAIPSLFSVYLEPFEATIGAI